MGNRSSAAMRGASALALFVLCLPTWASPIFRAGPGPDKDTPSPEAQYLSVPLDHFAASSPVWKLKYWINDNEWQLGGPLVVAMPQESLVFSSAAKVILNYSAPWASELKPVIVTTEHRFFGESVPNLDSSVANLKYHTVEQSLKDIVALIDYMRASPKFKSISSVIAVGGSYSGALAAWIRRLYPEKVHAAIAHSPVVNAFMDFPQYGISNLVALSSPDSRCANVLARLVQALKRQFVENKEETLNAYDASAFAQDPLGDFTFMYYASLLVTGGIQSGFKQQLCEGVEELTDDYQNVSFSDQAAVTFLAAQMVTLRTLAFSFSSLRNCTSAPKSDPSKCSVQTRPWWWLKCTQLGWFKTAPVSGLSSVPFEDLNVKKFLETCSYMYPGASLVNDQRIAAFNSLFGGAAQLNVTNVFTIDYSDDPWKMATTTSLVERQSWPLQETQPFMLLTCDGCGHCGGGAPQGKLAGIANQELWYLRQWLKEGISKPSSITIV